MAGLAEIERRGVGKMARLGSRGICRAAVLRLELPLLREKTRRFSAVVALLIYSAVDTHGQWVADVATVYQFRYLPWVNRTEVLMLLQHVHFCLSKMVVA
jgi:hypothetical protein